MVGSICQAEYHLQVGGAGELNVSLITDWYVKIQRMAPAALVTFVTPRRYALIYRSSGMLQARAGLLFDDTRTL